MSSASYVASDFGRTTLTPHSSQTAHIPNHLKTSAQTPSQSNSSHHTQSGFLNFHLSRVSSLAPALHHSISSPSTAGSQRHNRQRGKASETGRQHQGGVNDTHIQFRSQSYFRQRNNEQDAHLPSALRLQGSNTPPAYITANSSSPLFFSNTEGSTLPCTNTTTPFNTLLNPGSHTNTHTNTPSYPSNSSSSQGPPSFSQSQISLGVNSNLPPSISPTNPSTSAATSGAMGQQHKDKTRLEIILDSPYLTLKGTGPDVEPTTLSGHVFLYLTETTAFKEITLQFRGKARIPMPANESLINSGTSISYVICNHDWSFLEHASTSKRHSRSLKAGKHYFPFNLSIGGSLPSSICTSALGGASVAYKLRAVASRPGFAHNLQACAPVTLLRAFTDEALEYQQSLEIENTWPDKIMYAIMLPHKAWAAGDSISAILKFSPLAKGVRVASVLSALCEITKVYARSGTQEDTRIVYSTRHEIVEGRAVEVESMAGGMVKDSDKPRAANPHFGLPNVIGSVSGSPVGSRPASAQGLQDQAGPSASSSQAGPSSSTQAEEDARERDQGYENHDVVTYITLPVPPSSYFPAMYATSSTAGHVASSSATTPLSLGIPGSHSPLHSPSAHTSPSPSGGVTSHPHSPLYGSSPSAPSSSSSVLPSGPTFPPVIITPSHSLEPISVSHRIRWTIYIVNRDGHISELRCSLPVIVLDGRLKDEARDASLLSRRLMIRSAGIVSSVHPGADEDAWGLSHHSAGAHHGDGEIDIQRDDDEGEADRELPSYTAHVRDRVANMFLPEAATVRVSNPWVNHMGSGTASPSSPAVSADFDPLATAADGTHGSSGPGAVSASYQPTGLHPMAQLPQSGSNSSGAATPLEWVNSELMLSLSDDPLRRATTVGTSSTGESPSGVRTPPSVMQYVSAGPSSRWGSRVGSRAGSRSGSPERGGDGERGDRSRSGSPTFGHSAGASSSAAHAPAAVGYMYEPLPSSSTSTHAGPSATSSLDASSHHDHGHGPRSFQSLFKATIKPFTALSLGHKHRHEGEKHSHSHHTSTNSRDGSAGRRSREHSHSPQMTPEPSIHPLQPVNSTGGASTYSYTDDNSSVAQSLVAGPGSTSIGSTNSVELRLQPLPNSASTSQLPAMRRSDIPLASPIHRPIPARSHTTSVDLNTPALLHRVLSEVPDYSIASRGFIGGVPPLTSMRGLPSYEEAVHQPSSRPAENLQRRATEGVSGSPPISSLSRSEPDLAGRFSRAGVDLSISATATQRSQETEEEGTGILQRLESAHALSDLASNVSGSDINRSAEEDSEDEGIQMRVRSQTVTQR